jgi:hypothetical protein
MTFRGVAGVEVEEEEEEETGVVAFVALVPGGVRLQRLRTSLRTVAHWTFFTKTGRSWDSWDRPSE